MKRFRTQLDEISRAQVAKNTKPVDPSRSKASEYIKQIVDYDTTKYTSRGIQKRKKSDTAGRLVRMGQIGDEYAVWEHVVFGDQRQSSSFAESIEYFVVHRPTNTVAAVLNTKPTIGDKKTKEVNLYVDMLSVDPKLRKGKIGFSLPQALYKFLNTAGYRIQSGKSQTEGGKSVWKGLISDPELLRRTFVKYGESGGMEKYTPDKEHTVWVDANIDDLYVSHSRARGQQYEADSAIHKAQDEMSKSKTEKQKQRAKRKIEKARAEAAAAKSREEEIGKQIEGSESTLVIKPKGKAVTKKDVLRRDKSSVNAPARAQKQFKPGTAWRTMGGKWGAKRMNGTVDYFDDERAAKAWIGHK